MALHCPGAWHRATRRPAGAGLALGVLALLTACQQAPAGPSAADRRHAEDARPASAALAQTYERSCQTCHSQVASGAPLVGFAPHWQARLAQGMPTLLRHVREGLGGMPARGYCNDCGDAEFAALIVFMSTPLSTH